MANEKELRELIRVGLKSADKILRELSQEERDYMPCSEWDIAESEVVKVLLAKAEVPVAHSKYSYDESHQRAYEQGIHDEFMAGQTASAPASQRLSELREALDCWLTSFEEGSIVPNERRSDTYWKDLSARHKKLTAPPAPEASSCENSSGGPINVPQMFVPPSAGSEAAPPTIAYTIEQLNLMLDTREAAGVRKGAKAALEEAAKKLEELANNFPHEQSEDPVGGMVATETCAHCQLLLTVIPAIRAIESEKGTK